MLWKQKFQASIGFIFLGAFIGALYCWPDKIISTLIEWGTSMLIGVFLSGISGEVLEKFTGDTLKNSTLTAEIAGINFSVTLFFMATLIVRYTFF
jgi:hypothetical protein